MSYAPASLRELRTYLIGQTGLPENAVGIVGDSVHTYGYHLGKDRLPASDYSKRLARDVKGLSNAASALDIGKFPRLAELTAFLVALRSPLIREIIGPGLDGRAYRWDSQNSWSPQQRSRGDDHEWHAHISWFRDTENVEKVSLFRPFFEGSSPGEDDDMFSQINDSGKKVLWLQALLLNMGHDPGPVDAHYGPKTARAVLAAFEVGDGQEFGPWQMAKLFAMMLNGSGGDLSQLLGTELGVVGKITLTK